MTCDKSNVSPANSSTILLEIVPKNSATTTNVVILSLSAPQDHWNVVLRILRYIKRPPGQGLLYEDKGNTQVLGYCDADWAGCPIDRRSNTG